MSNVKVEFGTFTGLTLDDPILGRLDENPLDGGIAFTEVPQGVYAIRTTRGRDKDIGRTSAGSMNISLRNEDRFFDPLVGGWRDFTLPRLPVRVSVDDEPVFTGFADDWNYSYLPSGESLANVQATDYFSRFARQVNTGDAVPQETTGARLDKVLDQLTVNYLDDRDLDIGNSTLAAGTLDGDALNYMLNIVEQSEQGILFMTKDGTVAFRERLLSTVFDPVVFSDEQGIPFTELQIEYGSEELVNQAIVSGPSGVFVGEDLTSQVVYGITALRINTQLATLAAQEGLAQFMIDRFSAPEYRFRSLTVNMRALTNQQRQDVLGLEIGDQCDVRFTPNGIPPAISIRNRIIGISHDITVDSHRVTFNFEKLPFVFFVLDDPTFGKLDEPDVVLGF